MSRGSKLDLGSRTLRQAIEHTVSHILAQCVYIVYILSMQDRSDRSTVPARVRGRCVCIFVCTNTRKLVLTLNQSYLAIQSIRAEPVHEAQVAREINATISE